MPYPVELSDVLINLDQQINPAFQEPTVLEVLEPVICQQARLFTRAKLLSVSPWPSSLLLPRQRESTGNPRDVPERGQRGTEKKRLPILSVFTKCLGTAWREGLYAW